MSIVPVPRSGMYRDRRRPSTSSGREKNEFCKSFNVLTSDVRSLTLSILAASFNSARLNLAAGVSNLNGTKRRITKI